ncbi:hypothetical protein ID858_16490 [Xenorhabdus sp. DI]|uniref:hypothetical protein n=1 Tax=Xenorhabdus doucetiae TaxID=351671 RepID=UPI00199DA006|nr:MULTISPECIES: hypothetical protein [unclassified Xenorhabdus]MBD2786472.1 hypothetical protein [Xenorhabdus sp. 3]MBD2790091.1 hypothetical protein [Xenorhabdus sp. DI]
MSNLSEMYEKWGRDVIGRILTDVNGLIYVLETPDFDHPQHLQFSFSDNSGDIGFRCGKDGSTLEITKLPMQESDLGEYGKEVIMNMSASLLFHRYIGMVVSKVFLIYSNIEKATIGIKLVFDDRLSLIVINLGDEINIFEYLPLQFEKDEMINYFDMPH